MAKKATTEQVSADMRPPDYRYAVQMMRGDIEKKKDRIAGLTGEIGDVWAKIESKGVNKVGAKFFAKIDKLEGPERLDVLRSLNGLCDAAGWPEEDADLVDEAEGNVVKLRSGGPAATGKPDLSKQAALEEEKAGTPAEVKLGGKKPTGAEALAIAKAKFANGGKGPKHDPVDAYKGDDADLADDKTGDPDAQ